MENIVVDTACPLDCPDSCSLAVTVSKGKVIEIDGSHLNAPTGGYICAKVRRFGDRVYGEARLRHPAIPDCPPLGQHTARMALGQDHPRLRRSTLTPERTGHMESRE